MPTYDFRCPNGHLFEQRFARISEAPSTVACPTCAEIAERQISGGAALVFKGSGFYITDYGKDGKKDQRTGGAKSDSAKPAGESKAADASSSTPSESKSSESTSKPAESAPAAAPAPKPAPKPSSTE
jgi:putative FmdB family regulatory protein